MWSFGADLISCEVSSTFLQQTSLTDTKWPTDSAGAAKHTCEFHACVWKQLQWCRAATRWRCDRQSWGGFLLISVNEQNVWWKQILRINWQTLDWHGVKQRHRVTLCSTPPDSPQVYLFSFVLSIVWFKFARHLMETWRLSAGRESYQTWRLVQIRPSTAEI